LIAGLVAENESDCLFLEPLIVRQLETTLSEATTHVVNIRSQVVRCRSRMIDLESRLHLGAAETAGRCDILFVHSDSNERAKAEKLLSVVQAGESRGQPVVLVPHRETESWMIADPAAFVRLSGADITHLPASPKEAEKVKDPKKTLTAVMAKVNHRAPEDYFASLGQHVDLTVLAAMPSYAAWVADTEQALKGMRYL
jgi:hypothetical protein